jgi:hypothetical protein
MNEQDALLEQFVGSFKKLDDMAANKELFPIAWELRSGELNQIGWPLWKPARGDTERSCLEPLYAKLPCRFPPLFERLVLTYRWAEVEVGSCMLLANPLGPDLSRFMVQISQDPGLWQALIPAGYIQFGRAAGGHYDPVCFEVKSSRKSGDCRIVRIDHEEILCNNRVKVMGQVALNFEELVRQTIESAKLA